MENRIKRVRIVGKGHASCFERLLLEWYRRESFVDVILTCVGNPENLKDGTVPHQISANRSVLAAASPVFASMFRDNPIIEEDVRISVVGYSYTSLRSIIEYIYTGSLEFLERDKDQIREMLKDFLIPIPNTKNAVKEQQMPINVTTEEPIDEPIDEPIADPFPDPIAETAIEVKTETRKEQNEVDIQIVSSVSLSNDVQITSPTKTYRANRSKSLAPKVNTPATKKGEETPISSRINILRSTKKNQLDSKAVEDPPSNVIEKVLNPVKTTPTITKTVTKKLVNVKAKSRDLNLSLPEPDINPLDRTTAPQQNVIRVFNRNVEAQPTSKKQTTLEPPPTAFIRHGLSKSFNEKTVVQSESVFVPPIRVTGAPMKNGRFVFTVTEDMARAADYRQILTAIYDVPGIYTLYRERPTPNLDVPFFEPPELPDSHIFVPSYFDKKPLHTYQDRPTSRAHNITPGYKNISLSGFKIEAVHQFNGKVHICTLGEPIVNQASETLFEDHPLSYLNPDQMVSRLTLEHNYSFGETPLPIDSECSNRTELANDLEDYKSAIQLAINQQRRKNRLNHRIQSYASEISTLKRRAKELLEICNSTYDGHEMDPEYQHPNKKKAQKKQQKNAPVEDMDEKVPCTVCNKPIKRSWLKQHMVILHSEERNHLCDECGRTFVVKAQLRAHQLRQHKAVPGNHLCEHCGRSFRFARYLNRHMSLHSSEKPHVCRFCDKAFRLKPVLIKHIRTHTGEKPYKCTVCGRCFRQRTTYATHLKVHEKRQEAGVMGGEGSGLGQLPRLKCEFCSMTFKLDLFLMLHRAKHTGETPALPCPTCKETFPSIKELTLHRKGQHPDTVYACQICPKVFTNKANFDFHVHKHSNPDAIKKKYPKSEPADTGPCTCDFCDKVFKSRSALDYHIKGIHLGDKSLKCQFCDKTFSHKPSLEQHVRTHTGERPYKCDQCPSSFKQQQHLTTHMVVHTGERPYSCDHCDKTFPHKTTLYAHMRIHTGTRLICSHCPKVLPSLAQLMRHEENCHLNTNALVSQSPVE